MKKYLSYSIHLMGLGMGCFMACQGTNTDNTKERVVIKDEYQKGLIALSIDSSSVISALNFLKLDSYSEADGLGTLAFQGNYAGLPTNWTITLKENKAVIVSFDHSTQDTSAASVASLESWTTNFKKTVTKHYGVPWKDSFSAGSPRQFTAKKVVWRLKVKKSSDEEIIILSLSSDSYEHPPFTKHYDIQFNHFYLSDAPEWFMTMIN